MAQRLAKDPYTRRAEAITWVPWLDSLINDPPCLQRIWGRIFKDEEGDMYLNFDSEWRSRDLFKAWFENTIALTTLQARLANRITEIREENGYVPAKVALGPYTDSSNSLHIYGSYFHEIEGDSKKGIKSFFEGLKSRPFTSDSYEIGASRTFTSEQIREFFIDDGRGKGLTQMLKREKDEMPSQTYKLVEADLRALTNGDYLP